MTIALWMAYATLIGACAGATAAALEPFFAARRWPGRWLWALAVGLSLVVPAAVAVRPITRTVATERVPVPGETRDGLATPAAARADSRTLDTVLLGVWALASVLLLGSASLGAWQLRLARAASRREVLDGEVVAVTDDLGPGATPFGSPRIVVPSWIGSLDRGAVRLLVSHEREHLRAGDPALLLCAVGALALAPWNPALWWCVRRLRSAMEIDCDARVLSREADVRSYGELLLEVAGRRHRQPLAAYLTFADSSSPLERRIAAMTDVRRPLSRSRLAVSAAVAVLAVIVACEAKRPAPLAPVTDYVLEDGATKVRRTLEGPILPAGEQRARFPLDAAIAQHFPGLAAKGGTDDPIFFVLDGENRILTAKIAPSPSGAPGAPTWDFDVKRESIDRVEVIKRGELLPQGVRGGVILITLKAGEGLSRSR